MQGIIKVIGVGPGHRSCASGEAIYAIGKAEVLVGSMRLLDEFAEPRHTRIPVGSDLQQLVNDLEALRQISAVAVLVSGDTGLFSLAAYLEKHMDPQNLHFIPGVSPVQVIFARLKKPWHDVRIISLHGREVSGLTEQVTSNKATAILTSPEWNPARISQVLTAANVPDYPVAIGENLSYPEESITCSRLYKLAGSSNSGFSSDYNTSVMVIFNE